MKKFFLIASVITIGMPAITQAGPPSGAGNNARDYIPAPAGTAAMITYWKHISGNKFYADGDKVSDNVGVSADVFILRPVYWTQVGSLVFDPQLLVVGQDQQVDAGAGGAAATGLADPVAVASFWVVNQPDNKFWMAVSPFFNIPIGEYNKERPAKSRFSETVPTGPMEPDRWVTAGLSVGSGLKEGLARTGTAWT
ncbi:transporter [candidate division KSB1 bacterium]|nr:transporter [candidate division KSB1 bacterium]